MVSDSAPFMAVEGPWGAEDNSKQGFDVEDFEEECLGIGDAVVWMHMTGEFLGKDNERLGKKNEGFGREKLGILIDWMEDE